MTAHPPLLISDVDRTILTHDHRLLQSVVAAFGRARAQGLHIVLATARSPAGVRRYAEALGLTDLCICFNGGWIGSLKTGVAEYDATIPRDHAIEAMKAAAAAGMDPMWYAADGIHVLDKTAVVEREAGITGEALRVAANAEALPGSPNKIMCVAWTAEGQEAFGKIRDGFAGRMAMTRSHARLLELGPAGSKAVAARRVAAALGFDLGVTAAAGDAESDSEMLAQAGFALTVANAIDDIRRFADFVGRSCDDGGIADGVDWLMTRNERDLLALQSKRRDSIHA
jgi:Cof subfamily protein (haloacid dehalogenase superfamily)